MIDLGPHAGFIAASYVLSAAVVGGLIVWVIADYARQKRLLRALEAQGITRRSDAAGK